MGKAEGKLAIASRESRIQPGRCMLLISSDVEAENERHISLLPHYYKILQSLNLIRSLV